MQKTREGSADTGMAWGVKASFLAYIRAMPDGCIVVEGGSATTNGGEFYFPLENAERDASGNHTLCFGGGVRFTAHHGLLSVVLRRPRVQIHDGGGVLSVEHQDHLLPIADLRQIHRTLEGDVAMWVVAGVTLTKAGTSLFSGPYCLGEPLAPLTLRAAESSTHHY